MMGGWDRWGVVDSYRGVGGGTGIVYYLIVLFLLVLLSFTSHVLSLFFKWAEYDSCYVCFFVYYLFSLSLVHLTKSYWSIEIVVAVM